MRQYALADDAERLGWPAERVVGDRCRPGRVGARRQPGPGSRSWSARLLRRGRCRPGPGGVAAGALERRSAAAAGSGQPDRHAHHRRHGTCSLFNDLLLLGLKGTMSEAELHLLADCRAPGVPLPNAASCVVPLPVGYVYDDDGIILVYGRGDPPPAIADVFAALQGELGRPTRWSARSPIDRSRHAPTAARGPGRSAMAGSRTAAPDGVAQPGLRRRLRVRAAPQPPPRRPRRHHQRQGHDAATRPMGRRDPRPSPRLHQREQFLRNEQQLAAHPHPGRRAPGPRGPSAAAGHHPLRQLRTRDGDALQRRQAVL